MDGISSNFLGPSNDDDEILSDKEALVKNFDSLVMLVPYSTLHQRGKEGRGGGICPTPYLSLIISFMAGDFEISKMSSVFF